MKLNLFYKKVYTKGYIHFFIFLNIKELLYQKSISLKLLKFKYFWRNKFSIE